MISVVSRNCKKYMSCMLGIIVLISAVFSGCGKKKNDEKVLSNMNDDMEEITIAGNSEVERFEKDGINYNKISGVYINMTYPSLDGAVYKEKVNDASVYTGSINNGYGSGYTLFNVHNDDVTVLKGTINIEPYYFDKAHSKLLYSTEEVGYITYRLYNTRGYLYSSLYGCNREAEEGLIPRDESILGLSEPTKPILDSLEDGKVYSIDSEPVSIIKTDFDCGYYYEFKDGTIEDSNVYLAIIFLFEQPKDYSATNVTSMIAEELGKAIIEAEIHYESGETEKKYVGFKAYQDVNPDYYDVYEIELE